MLFKNDELFQASSTALKDCLKLGPDESILIITDITRRNIALSLLDAAREITEHSFYTEIPIMERNGQEPHPAIARLMREFNVVVTPTAKSLTHTNARRNACKSGTRVATMPGILEETMIRCLNADYHEIARRTEIVANILTEGHHVHVTTSLGTTLEFSIDSIRGLASTGLIHEKGASGNLPSGEAYLRPLEESAQGVLIIDGSMAGVGNLLEIGETIKIEIRDGIAKEITGGISAKKFDQMLTEVGLDAYTMAEFGIGTNHAARIIGNILEDEKVMGTIHVAFGNNISMGGSVDVPIHLDGIIQKPTVKIDDKIIMENGSLNI